MHPKCLKVSNKENSRNEHLNVWGVFSSDLSDNLLSHQLENTEQHRLTPQNSRPKCGNVKNVYGI